MSPRLPEGKWLVGRSAASKVGIDEWRVVAIASSFVRRGGLIRAGVAQDPKTLLLVGHVDVTARVDEDVLRLGHEVARQRAGALARLRRDEPATFDGQQRVLDVVDAQPGIEIGQVDQIAGLLDVGTVDLLIDIMRAEPAALLQALRSWPM